MQSRAIPASDETSTQSSKTSRILLRLRLHFNLVEVRPHHEQHGDAAVVVSASTATRDISEAVQEKLRPFTVFNV
jgi:hypothetical protein